VSADRDCIAEMDALIESETGGSDWVPAIVATKIIASADPELLNGWLHVMAPSTLAAVIRQRERSTRSTARARASSRAFAAASAAADEVISVSAPAANASSGDVSAPSARKAAIARALGSFSVTYAIDEKGARRRVADMTGADHRFVAADYEKDAKPLMLLAAFHQQVARKVGRKRTSEVFSETEYDRLYRSITRTPKEAVA